MNIVELTRARIFARRFNPCRATGVFRGLLGSIWLAAAEFSAVWRSADWSGADDCSCFDACGSDPGGSFPTACGQFRLSVRIRCRLRSRLG